MPSPMMSSLESRVSQTLARIFASSHCVTSIVTLCIGTGFIARASPIPLGQSSKQEEEEQEERLFGATFDHLYDLENLFRTKRFYGGGEGI